MMNDYYFETDNDWKKKNYKWDEERYLNILYEYYLKELRKKKWRLLELERGWFVDVNDYDEVILIEKKNRYLESNNKLICVI